MPPAVGYSTNYDAFHGSAKSVMFGCHFQEPSFLHQVCLENAQKSILQFLLAKMLQKLRVDCKQVTVSISQKSAIRYHSVDSILDFKYHAALSPYETDFTIVFVHLAAAGEQEIQQRLSLFQQEGPNTVKWRVLTRLICKHKQTFSDCLCIVTF